MTRTITYAEAINEATRVAMERDPRMLCFGLGIDDPKRVFGTTTGLVEQFGNERVFDTPTSENAMTGIAVGAAIDGARCLMTHQRLDFFLLALDQLVNNAAKWRYMFGGGSSAVSIVIRLILGRGWGQGPTHSQNLQSWFAHVPGLKVVMPTFPADARDLLLDSLFDGNPVVFLEHRWLHNLTAPIRGNEEDRARIGQARTVRRGSDLTIVSMSYMTVEAIRAIDLLSAAGISVELIDLRTIRPLDWPTVLESVSRTGRLIALDTSNAPCSVASEVVATCACECWDQLKCPPRRITLPDHPCPTSPALTEHFYPRAADIAVAVSEVMQKPVDVSSLVLGGQPPHDVPGDWFKGPF